MTADREVCGAERFMHSSGPSAVPLKACCAAAILHAAEGGRSSAPFICAEADALTTRTARATAEPDTRTARTAAGPDRVTASIRTRAARTRAGGRA
jgi:hypothetical protein